MPCNWELFEFRVKIYLRGTKVPVVGNFIGEAHWEFFNVSMNPKSLGIGDFQGSGEDCNFNTVFSELAKLRKLPFSFVGEKNKSNGLNFDNLEAAYKNKLPIRAAKLYVHRRDWSDVGSSTIGPGILLESVTVDFAARTPHFTVRLSGTSANTINF